MDLSEVGADFGSCGVGLGRNLIRILQNRPEVANSDQRYAKVGSTGRRKPTHIAFEPRAHVIAVTPLSGGGGGGIPL